MRPGQCQTFSRHGHTGAPHFFRLVRCLVHGHPSLASFRQVILVALVLMAALDAQVLLGLWQGFIAPVTFVISLFNDDVGVYEVRNTGGWYDFGFLLGLSMIFGGGGGGAARGRR